MNNKDFIKEVHQYIDERYILFEKYQQVVRSILLEFDRLCRKADVNYVLAYGNAIGAVRDHGQLPWDYDVDVLVSYDDKKKLITALQTILDKGYYYVYNDNTKKYPTICLRVGKKGYTWLAFHVDVFFYTGAPDDVNIQNRIIKNIKKLRVLNTGKNYPYHQLEKETNITVIKKLINYISKIKYLFVKDNAFERYMIQIGNKYPVVNSRFIITFGGVKIACFDKNYFKPQLCEVDGVMLPIPCGYKEYLKIVYKDYHSYLPIRTRFEEFYKMCNIVEQRQAIYEQQYCK